jgi:hypothetical protein
MFLFIASNLVGAYELKWRKEPYVHDSTYQIESYFPKDNGFEIYISKSKRKTFWHIQLISDDIFELAPKKYVIKFQAKSNKEFKLYSRLGEEQVNEGNSYLDHSWLIVGDGAFHEYRLDFIGKDIANFLYFQLGKAPSGTLLEVSDITIEPLE